MSTRDTDLAEASSSHGDVVGSTGGKTFGEVLGFFHFNTRKPRMNKTAIPAIAPSDAAKATMLNDPPEDEPFEEADSEVGFDEFDVEICVGELDSEVCLVEVDNLDCEPDPVIVRPKSKSFAVPPSVFMRYTF